MEQQDNKLIKQLFEDKSIILEDQIMDNSFKWKQIISKDHYKMEIYERRQFIKTESGWGWYKNLVIPSLKVQLEGLELDSTDYDATISCLKKLNNGKYEDVELIGKTQRKIIESKVQFRGLKFAETSFMSRSQYFILVVTVMKNKQGSINTQDNVIMMQVSPQLYIEARKKYWSERQSQITIFDPFLPNLVEKSYMKVSKKDLSKVQIGEDLQSLLNYFTSSSIRHKIRNPFFLLCKFPKAIKLFYNTELIQQQSQLTILIQQIQKQIYASYSQGDVNSQRDQRPLILCLNTSKDDIKKLQTAEKLAKYLSTLEGPAISFSPNLMSDLPANFAELKEPDQVREAYKKVYNNLTCLNIKMVQNDQELDCNQNLSSKDIIDENNQGQYRYNNLQTILDLSVKDQNEKKKRIQIKALIPFGTKKLKSNKHQQKLESEKMQVQSELSTTQIQNEIQVQQQREDPIDNNSSNQTQYNIDQNLNSYPYDYYQQADNKMQNMQGINPYNMVVQYPMYMYQPYNNNYNMKPVFYPNYYYNQDYNSYNSMNQY